ncbi:hypothetical protein K5D32_02485 [Pseudomonas cichorii]|uniref:hypothetical protein n=1 Tax=Pseudomonas cichorii TaxID=36746 RepID=UPI001C894033|nr:hypothetical protein [Pseudomonas cichorii]MBX8528510.1 hypothetical protein [Pseudomonas cichorii]
MPADQKARSAKAAAKRAKYAEKELRHRVRPGIEQAIGRISARADKMETSEMLQIAVMKMDLMSDEELSVFLKYPRHEIIVSESVARMICVAGQKKAAQIYDDE